MDIVKKNWLSILFGVIAIAAIVGDFYPMNGMREKLKEEATQRAAVATQLKDLADKTRNEPIVDLTSTDPKPLPFYPIEPTIKNAEKATALVSSAAKQVLDKASQINQHKLLVDGSLPGAFGQAVLFTNFARQYLLRFPQVVAGPNNTTAIVPGDLITSIKGGFPPSEADMTAARAKKQAQIELEDTTRDGANNPTNADQVKQLVDEALRTVSDDMRADVAKKCLVYVDPQAFSIFPNIQVGVAPEPSTIFWAQVGLWAQEDISRAIFNINQKSANVTEAPVKELVKISFEQPGTGNSAVSPTVPTPLFLFPGLTYQPGNGGQPPPPPAAGATPPPAPDPSGKLPVDFTMSPTGRLSNPMFDAVHFDVDLVIDAQSLPLVLTELGSGQYISIIQLNSLESVDSTTYRVLGYNFGDKPCVKIRVRCEELFLRKWLEPLIPPAIKTQLAIPTGTPGTPPA